MHSDDHDDDGTVSISEAGLRETLDEIAADAFDGAFGDSAAIARDVAAKGLVRLLCAIAAAAAAIGGFTLAGFEVWQGWWWILAAYAMAGVSALWRSVSTIIEIGKRREDAVRTAGVKFSLVERDDRGVHDEPMSSTIH